MVKVKIKKLRDDARLPERGSAEAAGYDVFVAIDDDIYVLPHETEKISIGLSFAVEKGYWIGLFARSGLATREGLRPANCVGIIDSDYRGPVMMAVHNDTDEMKWIHSGDKIGQLVVLPAFEWDIIEVDELDETERGEGGFGSTDNKK